MDNIWSDIVRLGTVAAVVWSASWFLFRQANAIKSLVYIKFDEVKKALIDKIEYHERHDDQRFDALQKDIWQIRVVNAARSGKTNGDH